MALNLNPHRENLIGVLAIDKAKHTLGLRLAGKNKQKNYIFNIKSNTQTFKISNQFSPVSSLIIDSHRLRYNLYDTLCNVYYLQCNVGIDLSYISFIQNNKHMDNFN